MTSVTQVLTGPYGAVLVGLLVLGVEYTVKAVVDRRRVSEPPPTQSADRVHVEGDFTQSIDARRTLTINQQRVVNHFQSPSPFRFGSADGRELDNDEMGGRLLIGGVLVLLAGGLSATVLAQHGRLVVNVLIGLAAGTALAAVHLWITHRRSLLPVGQWACLTIAAAAALTLLSTRLLAGAVGGIDLEAIGEETRGMGLWDAVTRVTAHGMHLSAFYLFKVLGALVAVFIALTLFSRLMAMAIALSALDSGRVQRWHVWVVEHVFPTQGVIATAAWGLFGLGFSYLLVSGMAHEWFTQASGGLP